MPATASSNFRMVFSSHSALASRDRLLLLPRRSNRPQRTTVKAFAPT